MSIVRSTAPFVALSQIGFILFSCPEFDPAVLGAACRGVVRGHGIRCSAAFGANDSRIYGLAFQVALNRFSTSLRQPEVVFVCTGTVRVTLHSHFDAPIFLQNHDRFIENRI